MLCAFLAVLHFQAPAACRALLRVWSERSPRNCARYVQNMKDDLAHSRENARQLSGKVAGREVMEADLDRH